VWSALDGDQLQGPGRLQLEVTQRAGYTRDMQQASLLRACVSALVVELSFNW
jgi:hypothetical protein